MFSPRLCGFSSHYSFLPQSKNICRPIDDWKLTVGLSVHIYLLLCGPVTERSVRIHINSTWTSSATAFLIKPSHEYDTPLLHFLWIFHHSQTPVFICIFAQSVWADKAAQEEVVKAKRQQGQQLLQQGGWGWVLYTAGHVVSGLSLGAARPGSETELEPKLGLLIHNTTKRMERLAVLFPGEEFIWILLWNEKNKIQSKHMMTFSLTITNQIEFIPRLLNWMRQWILENKQDFEQKHQNSARNLSSCHWGWHPCKS